MANPVNSVNLFDPAFTTTHAELITDKVDRVATTRAQSQTRANEHWGDFVDDFILATQAQIAKGASCLATYAVGPVGSECRFTSIQAAINQASTDGGGVVVVLPGTFTEATVALKTGVIVKGWAEAGFSEADLGGDHRQTTLVGKLVIDLVTATDVDDTYASWAGIDITPAAGIAVDITGSNAQSCQISRCKIESLDDDAIVISQAGGAVATLDEITASTPTANKVACDLQTGTLYTKDCKFLPTGFPGTALKTADGTTLIDLGSQLFGFSIGLQSAGAASLVNTDCSGGPTGSAIDIPATGNVQVTGGITISGANTWVTGTGTFTYDFMTNSASAFTEIPTDPGLTVNEQTSYAPPTRYTGKAWWWDNDTGDTPTSGAGTRAMWVPGKLAWRSGSVSGTEWDAANIGTGSWAHGTNVQATGTASYAFGFGCVASNSSAHAEGSSATAGGLAAWAFGVVNDAPADSAQAWGTRAIGNRIGGLAQANGRFSDNGDVQSQSGLTLRRATGDATPTELTLDGSAPSGTTLPGSNRIIIEPDRIYAFTIYVVGKDDQQVEKTATQGTGVISRDTTAGSTTLHAFVSDFLFESNAALNIAVSADTTNGSLKIEVTGIAATAMRWSARIDMVELRFDEDIA